MFTVNSNRYDPYRNFKFRVKWDGKYIAAISKISALSRNTEAIKHREGGDASAFRYAPGLTRFEPVILERGLSHDSAFEDWANMVFNIEGDRATSLKKYRKDIVIELYNLQGALAMAFKVYRCWVSEYQCLPELDAYGTCTAFEKIVLHHEGWERDKEVKEPTET